MTTTQPSTNLLVFGTYRLKAEVLDIALGQALHLMIHSGIDQPLVDTAVLYNNAMTVRSACARFPNVRVGTKVHRPADVRTDVNREKKNYGDRLHRVLLHKAMPIASYLALVKAKADGVVPVIGVSNYSAAELRELVAELKALDAAGELPLPLADAMPAVCQNEFHPFLRTSVPEVCRELGIQFEAHSVFTHLEEYPNALRKSAAKAHGDSASAEPTIGQIALAYALQRGGGSVVFNTANYQHMQENLDVAALDDATLAALDELKLRVTHARYAGSDTAAFRPTWAHHRDPAHGSGFEGLPESYIRDELAPMLKVDRRLVADGKVPSKTANGIPKLSFRKEGVKRGYLALARAFFTDDDGKEEVFHAEDPEKDADAKMRKMEVHLQTIRSALYKHTMQMKAQAKPAMCKARAIEDPEALPVDIPDPSTIQPFIDLVAATKKLPETAIRLERGVLFPDGRLDFCKQVAQPSFVQFCDAVRASGAIKHFLIGNNVGLQNDTDGAREAALCRLIREARGIETFYLAGNAISAAQVEGIAQALAESPDAKYAWFKMNPVQTGSYHLARAFRRNTKLELLDLFNTGQCDAGIAAMLRGDDDERATHTAAPGLRHLYLDINAITDGAAVGELAARYPALETLSVNVNQLRDAGIAALCDRLLAIPADRRPPLERIVLGSNGATNASLPSIINLVRGYPRLVILQLGAYKSTRFFQQQSNSFTDSEALFELGKALAANAKASGRPQFNYLGIQHAYPMSDASQMVLQLADLGLHVNGVQWNYGGKATTTSKQLNQLLGTPTNVQPAPVEYIQSVYRNNM